MTAGTWPAYSAGVPEPITAADVTNAVELYLSAFAGVADDAWDAPAGTLTWTCWETVEHVADDLFAYAAQIAPSRPPQDSHVPISWRTLRPDGPKSAIFVDREAGTAGLLQVLEVCGVFLAATVRGAPAKMRAHHIFGRSDPEGFAAMGVVELLAHGYDVARGLDRDWRPPGDLCARALHRLFPDAPTDQPAWPTLRWATGRGDLPGRAVQQPWRWNGTPRSAT
jgi:hypothetical protein